jgi:hypothetical protein
MLVSVPAHQSRFSVVDELVGHFRRYEREQLRARFAEAGFEVEVLWCYGYPLANVLERVRRAVRPRPSRAARRPCGCARRRAATSCPPAAWSGCSSARPR